MHVAHEVHDKLKRFPTFFARGIVVREDSLELLDLYSDAVPVLAIPPVLQAWLIDRNVDVMPRSGFLACAANLVGPTRNRGQRRIRSKNGSDLSRGARCQPSGREAGNQIMAFDTPSAGARSDREPGKEYQS